MDSRAFPHSQQPPVVPQRPVILQDEHGHRREDNYHWLEDRDSDEVLAWLEKENGYTRAGMASTEELQKVLYREMKARLKEDDESLPYRWHGYEFFIRTFKGKDYAVHYRRKVGSDQEQVIFDGNVYAEGQEYFDLGVMAVSPDNQLLAWAEDFAGNESWTLRVRNLAEEKHFDDVLEGCSANIIWAADSQSFWYIRQDKTSAPGSCVITGSAMI